MLPSKQGFPGHSVVKNLPANAEDTGLIPDPGRSHKLQSIKPMPHNYWACAPEPGNHNNWAHVQELLKPTHLELIFGSKRSHRREKPAHCN